MGMAVKINKFSRISALLFIIFSVIMFSGCGKAGTPPPGAIVTIKQIGDTIISDLTVTAIAAKTQSYHVAVADSSGNPLEGVKVNVIGQFDSGTNIGFGGLVAVGSAPITISSLKTTDNLGFITFDISVPYFTQGVQLHAPYNQTAVGSATGGILAGGTYSYTVTALDFAGETNATAPISALVSAGTSSFVGSVALSWSAVPGATSYNVYGRILGFESLMITVLCPATSPCSDPVTFVDTGQNPPSGTPPPSGNNTGISLNSIKGSLFATAGASISPSITIDF